MILLKLRCLKKNLKAGRIIDNAKNRVEEALPNTSTKRKELTANLAGKEGLIIKKTEKHKSKNKLPNNIHTAILQFYADDLLGEKISKRST